MTTTAAAPIATPAMAPEERPFEDDDDELPEPAELLLPELPLPELPLPEPRLLVLPSRPPPEWLGAALDDENASSLATLVHMALAADMAATAVRNSQRQIHASLYFEPPGRLLSYLGPRMRRKPPQCN